ncbi:hypothetical protein P152DRAFT_460064 [Eremomyces bilateralis CBS 781.70]|uniref:Uncharacterized protein n=1 Tax=Eremomyces bilateralis CBS 781.70 TaxID=1392243 RepID=A0A6G1FY19_9PEZI|nr:uncharacterized protein P152DRAFT_460064 [Eremomyces bilateralis CBS 781.70]KAF1810775.1 hypothetical protein P152DRAFT_460064 [Eremomyces bilateralis CBS 781.70]
MAQKLYPRAGKTPEELEAKFVPIPSVGHEMGIMFGFIGLMLIGVTGFWVWWTFRLKREDTHERARVEDLRARGLLKEGLSGNGASEKQPIQE